LRRLRWAQRFGLPLLPALLAGAAAPLALAERLQLPHRDHKLLAQWLELRHRWQQQATAPWPQWGVAPWCQWLEAPGLSPEAVALELATGGAGPQLAGLPRRPLLRWWLRWRHLKPPCSAAELMAAEGLRPGPALGERLRQLRAERLAQERC
jgi:poly(A) polymerase